MSATAAAQDLADEHGIDIASISGSGENGRVLVSDVREVVTSRDLWDEWVEVGEWHGQKNYECTIPNAGFVTLDRNRMEEYLRACKREGLIPITEEGEDDDDDA